MVGVHACGLVNTFICSLLSQEGPFLHSPKGNKTGVILATLNLLTTATPPPPPPPAPPTAISSPLAHDGGDAGRSRRLCNHFTFVSAIDFLA